MVAVVLVAIRFTAPLGYLSKPTTHLMEGANYGPALHEQHTMLHLHLHMEQALLLTQHVQVVPHNLWEVLASDDC
jgi:hypothetical protein